MEKEKLNKKQRYALDTMLSGSNVFLTGDAGTGKTTVIQTFIDEAEKAGKSVLVSATTGIAADNIGYGATTVHRALNISIKFEDYKKKVKSRAELLEEADILIIDEISMCRFDLFNMIAKIIITENEERAVGRLLGGEDKEDIQHTHSHIVQWWNHDQKRCHGTDQQLYHTDNQPSQNQIYEA